VPVLELVPVFVLVLVVALMFIGPGMDGERLIVANILKTKSI
jgi:hypothetical protein